MNARDKTHEELEQEVQELRAENIAFKISSEKDFIEHNRDYEKLTASEVTL